MSSLHRSLFSTACLIWFQSSSLMSALFKHLIKLMFFAKSWMIVSRFLIRDETSAYLSPIYSERHEHNSDHSLTEVSMYVASHFSSDSTVQSLMLHWAKYAICVRSKNGLKSLTSSLNSKYSVFWQWNIASLSFKHALTSSAMTNSSFSKNALFWNSSALSRSSNFLMSSNWVFHPAIYLSNSCFSLTSFSWKMSPLSSKVSLAVATHF